MCPIYFRFIFGDTKFIAEMAEDVQSVSEQLNILKFCFDPFHSSPVASYEFFNTKFGISIPIYIWLYSFDFIFLKQNAGPSSAFPWYLIHF